MLLDDVTPYWKLKTRKNPHLGGFKDVTGLLKTLNWWRRRELNPRPQALYRQFYILSQVI
ncbi:protein of unknown function [Candidatus Nitrotoga arctica]|uniref:Uncharacterized protein n=1 Tax=Candidatus Nitrotoga arctica TaxID=453162 RepID=A0ABN8APE5_9PROT|nr:protein of unknown function [Candidatus Nitrotoga arctica]